MRCFAGIDLGSTTTKCVLIDEDANVIGRGLTNSRSDYDVACAVSRSEALADARFGMARKAMPELGTPESREKLLELLAHRFRLAQHRAQLEVLRQKVMIQVPAVERLYPAAALEDAVSGILDDMECSTEALFAPGARKRSHFFRDNAASQYATFAEPSAEAGLRPYDALLGVFDKAILNVENQPIDLPFSQAVGDSLDTCLDESGYHGEQGAQIRDALSTAFAIDLEILSTVGTGYGRVRLPFPKRQIRSEILCHGLGAHEMFPGTATVLDIGGQDTKAIQVDPSGIVTSFQMNDRCAAGCGRYLGYIADEMNLGVHELGPMAQKATRAVRINSTCTVFAGAELRDRLTLGEKREDILAGLHRAIILRAMSLLARSGGVRSQFTFTGGVANNVAAVAALRQLISENYGEMAINISPDSIYTGALGAAVFAQRDGAPTLEEAA